MKRLLLISTMLIATATAPEARAQSVHGCFERALPAVYVRRHGMQSLQRIQLQTLRSLETAQAMAHVRIWFSGDSRAWEASGPCKNDLSSMVCVLDGDGGRIAITQESNGARLKAQGALTVGAGTGRATVDDPVLKNLPLPKAANPQCKTAS